MVGKTVPDDIWPRFLRHLLFAVGLVLGTAGLVPGTISGNAAMAQSVTAEIVNFPRDKYEVTLSHRIRGDQQWLYVVKANKGDRLQINMQTSNPSAYFDVAGTGRTGTLHVGAVSGNSFNYVLEKSDDYQITVYLARDAVRRGDRAENTLTFKLAPTGRTPEPTQPQPARSLVESKEWEIQGLKPNETLNVMRLPWGRGEVVAIVRNGHILRNMGCFEDETGRWCRLLTGPGGETGWLRYRYLKAADKAPQPATQPKGNGKPFDATGFLSCAVRRGEAKTDCAYGVQYGRPKRSVTLWVALGRDRQRMIEFRDGAPIASDANTLIEYEYTARGIEIRIGSEAFTVKERIIAAR
jgi:hypothetical protein